MDEAEFWLHLEYRICDEIAGFPDRRLRRFWCDGFLPGEFAGGEPMPRIVGRSWMAIHGGSRQEQWGFALLLGRPVASRGAIDWSALLPSRGMTRWLSLDPARRTLVIEPTAAVPDRRPR